VSRRLSVTNGVLGAQPLPLQFNSGFVFASLTCVSSSRVTPGKVASNSRERDFANNRVSRRVWAIAITQTRPNKARYTPSKEGAVTTHVACRGGPSLNGANAPEFLQEPSEALKSGELVDREWVGPKVHHVVANLSNLFEIGYEDLPV
jgi:hypothetical protein